MQTEVRQTKNLSEIKHRLKWLNEVPEGRIFFEPSGIHFIVVEKKESRIYLSLIEQVNFSSQLVQSYFDLNDPLYLASPYNQAAMLVLAWQSQPQKIYIAGFGGGRIPLVLHHYFPEATIECTEIDPNLIKIATKFFGVQLDRRLTVAIEDGRKYLSKSQQSQQYDLIIIDVCLGSGYMSYYMNTKEFYELCQEQLSDLGTIVVNLLQTCPFYAEKVKTIQSVFAEVCICPVETGNTIVIGSNGPPIDKSELMSRSKLIQDTHGFSFPLMKRAIAVKMGIELLEYIPNLPTVEILTDAFPPPGYFDNLPAFNTVFAQVGSQDPCPCGSGQEYQQCHG
jgi:spermidine synthase